MVRCRKCGKPLEADAIFTNAYDEIRCEYCYDDYLMTDRGKVEYFLGICKGDFPMDHYDADFLGHIATCWKKYRNELYIPAKVLADIEIHAACIGLL